ncbi:MAG: DUF975 family protein [Clostridia bacterium]|nr:DUF975 family protein [Clostridia bacterium]
MNNASAKNSPAFYRFIARRALKGHWLTALQIALIVSLLPMLVRGIFSYTSGGLNTDLNSIYNAMLSGTVDYQPVEQFFQKYSSRLYLFAGLEVAAFLIIPCLSLGMNKWSMDRLRGLEGPVTTVFCRVRLFFRACGLEILVALKILLWTLPGIALNVLVYFVFVRLGSSFPEMLSVSTYLMVYVYLLLPSVVVPAFLAYLRYALAEFVLADKPETKITDCIRRSKSLLQGNKRLLVLNVLFFLLLEFVSSLFSGLPGVLYYMVVLLYSLVISVYWCGTLSAIYLSLEHESIKEQEPEPAPDELS